MPAILRCFRIAGFLFSKEGCYITQNEVNAVFDEQVRLCADTLKRKTKEYTGDDPDRLGAFKAAAALQHTTPQRALAGMLAKHIVSLYDMCFAEEVVYPMLSTPECMKAVAKKLLQYKPQNVVIDPVMYAKNGCPLMNPTAVSTLIDTVIPLADVLTPNIPEAEKIADMQISTVSDMEAAARKIYAMGCKAIVVKGGHHIGNAVDVLFNGENFYHFETSRIDTKNTHGTGCTFSSAIASQLAKGKSVPLAVESAKAYVTMAIEHSLAIGKGCGPTHHFYELYQHGLSKE